MSTSGAPVFSLRAENASLKAKLSPPSESFIKASGGLRKSDLMSSVICVLERKGATGNGERAF